jgi:predicted nucleotidyltransferase component of viral defense system
MLRIETVEPRTLSILKELMQVAALNDFHLVGGTALSLLYGHRMSVDLDLFSNKPFENSVIIDALKNKFQEAFTQEDKHERFGIFCYPHPMIRSVYEQEGIRFFSTEDIIAMKVQAILGRGKKKDFWDVAELLNHFPVQDFIDFHKEKYVTQHLLISVPQALSFFMDADESENPISLKQQTWESVQAFIAKKVSDFLL